MSQHIKPYIYHSILALVILTTIGCGGKNTSPDNASPTGSTNTDLGKVYNLQISRYTTASIDNASVDAILQNATTVLRTKDSETDVSCDVTLLRSNEIATFTAGDGSVDSEDEYKAMLALPGHIKIVNQINWCGAFKPNVVGCAPTPGGSFIAVRFNPTQEGILWGHEFGHNKGQVHRNEPTAIMNEFIEITHRGLNQAECNAILK